MNNAKMLQKSFLTSYFVPRDEEIIQRLIEDVETYEDHRVHAFKYLKSRFSAAALNTTFRPVCEALVRHKFFEVKERD